MRKHLSTRDRIIIQYQIEHIYDVSLKSLALDLKCHASTVYRELKRNIISLESRQSKFMHHKPIPCPSFNGATSSQRAPQRSTTPYQI